ncbi:hypothetical protein B0181_05035 [Moraxella caviae]|uniref:Predicted nucleic acid-binding protein, contains PIN domain n=1 Tax=Moraxella caviae TaxID=34060 RepID=A0A1T0A3U9_9GAMM|nr:PIN domain-containing protein [Moraxella caviae]OOR90239.1 hypothetical protein B0181_05035 [Moraxella caviae]STZ14540.1 Predicted nucleic acid-binding protein, contains PIN domain [Moraxella caviae]VEW12545.1 Predicted nucleic acid-binding protein, contains PIN domain [Moraxella caviae]
MPKYLLDTCFIIALKNKDPNALQMAKALNIQAHECAISVINRIEVLGFPQSEQDSETFVRLMANFVQYPLSTAITARTIGIRQQDKIKLPDCIVLATALEHDLVLITFDEKLKRKYQTYTA